MPIRARNVVSSVGCPTETHLFLVLELHGRRVGRFECLLTFQHLDKEFTTDLRFTQWTTRLPKSTLNLDTLI
jgi:hypothetical protein